MCNKVRHVIEEEEVCYLIYLRGRQVFFFFLFFLVSRGCCILQARYLQGRYELTSRYNPSIQMHEFLSWVKRATIWFFFFFIREETCVACFSPPGWSNNGRPQS